MKLNVICRSAIIFAAAVILTPAAYAGYSFSWSWSGGGASRSGHSPTYSSLAQCESARTATSNKIRASGAMPHMGNCSGSGGGSSGASSGYSGLGGQIQSAVGAIGDAFRPARQSAPAGPDPAVLQRQKEAEEAERAERLRKAEEARRLKAEEERKTHDELMGNLKRTGTGLKLKKTGDFEPQIKKTEEVRSGSCSNVLSGAWNTLHQFGQEGQEFGYTFAKEQYTEALKSAGEPLTDAAAQKLGAEKYKANYETTQKGLDAREDLKQYEKDFTELMAQIKACAAQKGCEWMGMLKNTANGASSWVRTVASDDYNEALKRAEEARRFLTNYIKRMESASEKLMTNASRCMNTKI